MSDGLNDIFLKLGKIESDLLGVKEDLTEIKQITSDYKTTKNRLIGACIAVSAGVGGGLSAVLNKLGIHV